MDSGLERYFDCSGFYPAEVVPLRAQCGSDFDPQGRYTRVVPDLDTGFLVHRGLGAYRWHLDMVIDLMNSQIDYWERCWYVGPWYMQPESALQTA